MGFRYKVSSKGPRSQFPIMDLGSRVSPMSLESRVTGKGPVSRPWIPNPRYPVESLGSWIPSTTFSGMLLEDLKLHLKETPTEVFSCEVCRIFKNT